MLLVKKKVGKDGGKEVSDQRAISGKIAAAIPTGAAAPYVRMT